MKRCLIVFFIFLFVIEPVFADTSQDDRRIEEEKRTSLRPTVSKFARPSTQKSSAKPGSTAAFFDQLLLKATANYADAAQTLVTLLGVEETHKDFESRMQFLKENDYLPRRINPPFDPNSPLQRGDVAYMVFKILGFKGGLTIRLTGASSRYAHKELVYQGIMYAGSENEIITGEELTYIFIEAAEYLNKIIDKSNNP